MEDFARTYFASVLSASKNPVWVDIDEKRRITASEAVRMPALSGVIPNDRLLEAWIEIHDP
jgi:hypothetical protein